MGADALFPLTDASPRHHVLPFHGSLLHRVNEPENKGKPGREGFAAGLFAPFQGNLQIVGGNRQNEQDEG
ncbi:hypothetical protein SDC9_37286 [bioreactor metagenome]|uniref:Uncharacterized protein n=1 Tax=bioreactor metagenome TaxID=1076179 RepID=A0A644VJ35_9ZZZZ